MEDKINSFDICIVGGGINGAGIANLASQLGLKVFLCEKNDYASQTSSSSTKLIHGGISYLEQYDFRLVYKALNERVALQTIADHIIWPVEFILIINPKIRSNWIVRLGLFVYDFLASINNKNNIYHKHRVTKLDNKVINNQYRSGYIYTDLWVDDARLVLYNIKNADLIGAVVNKNTKLIGAEYNNQSKIWHINLENSKQKSEFNIKAKILINSSGPWVNDLLTNILNIKPKYNIKLVKGSHIVVNHKVNNSYVIQIEDKRIIFVIPYEDDFTLIGTTEENVSIEYLRNNKITISDIEVDYLLSNYNNYFNHKLTRADIIHSYSGVRPLIEQPNKNSRDNTRDYLIDTNYITSNLINIYGGKITTYRILAVEVMSKIINYYYKDNLNIYNKLKEYKKNKIISLLPGCMGTLQQSEHINPGYNRANHQVLLTELASQYPYLDKNLLSRYIKTYGSLSYQLLNSCESLKDMGQYFGSGLYQKEVDYLIQHEYADTVDDIIWRRTKLGLKLNHTEIKKLLDYLK